MFHWFQRVVLLPFGSTTKLWVKPVAALCNSSKQGTGFVSVPLCSLTIKMRYMVIEILLLYCAEADKIHVFQTFNRCMVAIFIPGFSSKFKENIITSVNMHERQKCYKKHWGRLTKFCLRELLIAPSSGATTITLFVFCKTLPISRKWSVVEVKLTMDTIRQLEFKPIRVEMFWGE